MDTASASSGRH
jgi:hypothetical protein